MNARRVRALGPNVSNSSVRRAVRLVRPDEVREVASAARRGWPGRRGRPSAADLDVRRIEATLPGAGIVMMTSPPISSDQWRWCRIAAPERSCPQAAGAELGDRPLEHRHARPGQRRRIDDDPVALGLHPQPVLEPAHHHGDDRAHVVDRQALGLASAQATLDRLAGGDRLGHAEGDRGIHVHAPVGRLLHDPRRPTDVAGNLTMMFGASDGEVLALGEHPVERTEQGRVGLHREATLPAAGGIEGRPQQRRRAQRHLLDDRPGEVDLGRVPDVPRPGSGHGRASGRGRPSRRRRRSSGWPSPRPPRTRWRTRAHRPRTSRSRYPSPSWRSSGRAGYRPTPALEPPRRRVQRASTARPSGSALTLEGAVRYGPADPRVIDYATGARAGQRRTGPGLGGIAGGAARMSTVTAARPAGLALRRRRDALPRASIGTVPMLWTNADRPGRARRPPPRPSSTRSPASGTRAPSHWSGFPDGADARDGARARDLRLAEVYVPLPATIDGPRPTALDIARERLRLLHDGRRRRPRRSPSMARRDRDRAAGRARPRTRPSSATPAGTRSTDVLHAIAERSRCVGQAMAFHPHGGHASSRHPPRSTDSCDARIPLGRRLPRHRPSPRRRRGPRAPCPRPRRAADPRPPQGRRSATSSRACGTATSRAGPAVRGRPVHRARCRRCSTSTASSRPWPSPRLRRLADGRAGPQHLAPPSDSAAIGRRVLAAALRRHRIDDTGTSGRTA